MKALLFFIKHSVLAKKYNLLQLSDLFLFIYIFINIDVIYNSAILKLTFSVKLRLIRLIEAVLEVLNTA